MIKQLLSFDKFTLVVINLVLFLLVAGILYLNFDTIMTTLDTEALGGINLEMYKGSLILFSAIGTLVAMIIYALILLLILKLFRIQARFLVTLMYYLITAIVGSIFIGFERLGFVVIIISFLIFNIIFQDFKKLSLRVLIISVVVAALSILISAYNI